MDNIDPKTGRQVPRTYKLEDSGYDGIVRSEDNLDNNMAKVIEKANEWGNEIPIGIFYQNEFIPTYEDRITSRIDNYMVNPPARQDISDNQRKPISTISGILEDLRVDNI
jgi:2-oxoglutarate ferredoxin oxidoreductase subunit beta